MKNQRQASNQANKPSSFPQSFASPGHGVFPFATKGSARLLMSSVEKESPRSRALPAIVELAIVGGETPCREPQTTWGDVSKEVSKPYQ